MAAFLKITVGINWFRLIVKRPKKNVNLGNLIIYLCASKTALTKDKVRVSSFGGHMLMVLAHY